MLLKMLLALVAIVTSTLALVDVIQETLKGNSDIKCPKVRILGIRGTLEKYPYGELQDLVDSIIGELHDVDDIAIDYPAEGIDIIDKKRHPRPIQYGLSEKAGILNFTDIMMDSVEECPDAKLVLLGYSQGVYVIGDVLCGRSSNGFSATLPIDQLFMENVREIIQLGDPTNVKDLLWHRGAASRGGLFPRQNWDACSMYGDFWQSWCDEQDIFCASEGDVDAHELYVKKYTEDITDFVIENLKEEEDENTPFARLRELKVLI